MTIAPPPPDASPAPDDPATPQAVLAGAAPDGRLRQGHVPALDGLRGVAILLVLAIHTHVTLDTPWPDKIWSRVSYAGWTGVDLFFVLSGFLITGILFDAKGGRNYFRNFYARRTLRIFPLYYAFLFAVLVLAPALGRQMVPPDAIRGRAIWYWIYLSNFLQAFQPAALQNLTLTPTWSLAVEEQFYIAWPAAVFLLERRSLMRLCLVLIPVAMAVRVGLLAAGPHDWAVYALTPSRMDSLAIGGLLALLIRGEGGIEAVARQARPAMLAAALVLAVLTARGRSLGLFDPYVQVIGYPALAVFFAGVLLMALEPARHPALDGVLGSRFLRFFGKYSYAIYLFHFAIAAKIRLVWWGAFDAVPQPWHGSRMPAQAAFSLLTIALTSAAAVVSWNAYEKHFLKLKRYFHGG